MLWSLSKCICSVDVMILKTSNKHFDVRVEYDDKVNYVYEWILKYDFNIKVIIKCLNILSLIVTHLTSGKLNFHR